MASAVWRTASRDELIAEIDRLAQANAEIRAELAVRDATDTVVTAVGQHLIDCAFSD